MQRILIPAPKPSFHALPHALIHLSSTFLSSSLLFCDSLSPAWAVCMCIGALPFSNLPATTPIKKNYSSNGCQLSITPQLVCCGKGSYSPSPSWRNAEHFVLVQVTTAAVSSWAQWLHHAQKTAFQSMPSHFLALTIFAFFILGYSLNFVGVIIDVPVMGEHSTVAYSHHFDNL